MQGNTKARVGLSAAAVLLPAAAGAVLLNQGLTAAAAACLAAAPLLGVCVWLGAGLVSARARFDRLRTRFEAYSEASSQWFWETDADHRYVWFSRSVEKYTDFPREWHYGKSRLDLARPAGPDPEWEAHLSQIEAHEPFRDYAMCRRAPDGVRYLRSSGIPKFGEDGTFLGYLGSGSDITTQVTMHELLRHAIDAISEGIAIFGPDDRLILCNRHYLSSSAPVADRLVPGLDYTEMIGLFARSNLPESWSEARREAWRLKRLALRDSSDSFMETEVFGGNWCRIVDYRTDDGGTVVVRTEITSLIERQQELRRERDRAEMASRAKTEFLTNMSHELRTPLNAIIGFSDAMDQKVFGPLPERYDGYVKDIGASGRHLLSLINDLLDIAKIEAGQYDLQPDDFPASDCCRSVISLMQAELDRRGQKLVMDVHLPGGAEIHADQRAIKQVLFNLLSNASKFSPDGAGIGLTARNLGRDLEIRISDQGRGISEEDLSRVFERFVQVESAMSRSHSGTGIGLPLSRSLAEAHGGSLELQSAPMQGTTAILRLPGVLRFPPIAATG